MFPNSLDSSLHSTMGFTAVTSYNEVWTLVGPHTPFFNMEV